MGIPNRTKARAGFTVVEIMIVVLVVALRVALAVPAFARMQKQALRTRCKSNLRQIYIALQSYSNGYNGILPTNIPGGEAYIPYPVGGDTPGTPNADGTTNWIGWIGSTPAARTAGRVPWGLGKLHAQVGDDLRVLFCPADYTRDADTLRALFLHDTAGDTPQCSYVFRGRFAPDSGNIGAIRGFQADDSVHALVMDYYYNGMTRENHDGYVCILFEDGSNKEFRTGTSASPTRFIDPLAGLGPLAQMWRAADRVRETD